MSRVLLVDDEEAFVKKAARYLEELGYDTAVAVDGREALDLAQEGDFDAVVTDINMPEVDGIGVLMALSTSQPGVPVVVMSGGGRISKEELLGDASMLGAVEALAKPFSLSELAAAIDRVT